jgi:RimJ/RimL family protein N-acetyltransferase
MKKADWQAFEPLDSEIFPDDKISREDFIRFTNEDGSFIIESESGMLVGYLILRRFGDNAGHLGRIGVARSMHGKGFGTILMEFALNWFGEQGGIQRIIVYTQKDNIVAQSLYRKFGFEVVATTWHYFVPFDTLNPSGRYRCQLIQPSEIKIVGKKYNVSLPAAQIQRFIDRGRLVFTLKSSDEKIVGACRFTPSFPGCFPFEIDFIESFDDFISGIRPHSLPKFDFIRVTFTDNEELATLCNGRSYKLHHILYKMQLEFTK